MERERACAAGGSRSRYYYYSALTTNIECNKKKRAEFDFDTREECESRPWRAFYLYIYTHTHISSLEKEKEAELIGILSSTHGTSVRLFLPGRYVCYKKEARRIERKKKRRWNMSEKKPKPCRAWPTCVQCVHSSGGSAFLPLESSSLSW